MKSLVRKGRQRANGIAGAGSGENLGSGFGPSEAGRCKQHLAPSTGPHTTRHDPILTTRQVLTLGGHTAGWQEKLLHKKAVTRRKSEPVAPPATHPPATHPVHPTPEQATQTHECSRFSDTSNPRSRPISQACLGRRPSPVSSPGDHPQQPRLSMRSLNLAWMLLRVGRPLR